MIQTMESTLAQHLDAGEQLLWSGKRREGVRLRAQDAFLIPFSILWCGFAIFWECAVISKGAPFFFMLWGIPFILAGLFFVFGRFFFDAWSRAHTFYGVTSERILIVSGIFSQRIQSLQLRTLSDIALIQKDDGSGTINFGPTHYMNSFFPAGGWPGAGRYAVPSFDLIEGAKEVHDIVRNAQRAASAKG
jgi:hypothetical protein